MRDAAAPNTTIIAQIITPSDNTDEIRSSVTSPPIRTPGIHDGSGIRGSEKIVVPGIGIPIVIATKVRMTNIQIAILRVHMKLFPQGASSRAKKTIKPTTPTNAMAKIGELTRAIEIATANDQIHHVSG